MARSDPAQRAPRGADASDAASALGRREPADSESAPKLPISVCVMACNDEQSLARCLESVVWAEEIVVAVDSKSTDGSERLARRLATRVEVNRYAGDIEQKRYVTDLARFDWILSLDSDERVSPQLAREIHALFASGRPECAGYQTNRITHHHGRWVRHGDWHPDWKLRLFHRPRMRWVGRNPHGRAEVSGPVRRLAGDLQHHSFRDLSDQIERIQLHSGQAAQALFLAGRRARLADLVLRPPARFLRCYVAKRGFLDGVPGFLIAASVGFAVFLKYAKLWELGRDSARQP